MSQVTAKVAPEASQVVTALRIVEREEKTDDIIKRVLTERGIPLAQLPGRPKSWKHKCFQMMETSISNGWVWLSMGRWGEREGEGNG